MTPLLKFLTVFIRVQERRSLTYGSTYLLNGKSAGGVNGEHASDEILSLGGYVRPLRLRKVVLPESDALWI